MNVRGIVVTLLTPTENEAQPLRVRGWVYDVGTLPRSQDVTPWERWEMVAGSPRGELVRNPVNETTGGVLRAVLAARKEVSADGPSVIHWTIRRGARGETENLIRRSVRIDKAPFEELFEALADILP